MGPNVNDFLTSIGELRLDAKTKGVPLVGTTIRLADVGAQGWNVLREDLMFPILTLRDTAFKKNMKELQSFAKRNDMYLAPHGKTSMCPQLYRELTDDCRCWGITAATVQQACVVAASGIENVILANEVVGRANIEQLALLKSAYPATSIFSLVDSPETVDQLVTFGAPRLAGRQKFQVLLEAGHKGGRTGVRTREQARSVIAIIKENATVLELVGIEFYEGTINAETPERIAEAVDEFLDFVASVVMDAESMNAFCPKEVLITGGGSVCFDRIAGRVRDIRLKSNTRIVLRGSCYFTHDHGHYRQQWNARGEEFRSAVSIHLTPALELWAMVESLQDPFVAVTTMGLRDMPYDLGYPIPLCQYREARCLRVLPIDDSPFVITGANDQHTYMSYAKGSDIRVGDLFSFGVSHPCTAFDKWDVLYRIDDDLNVIDALKTFF